MMSDSSEDEDLSKFQEAVDTSFTKLIDESRGKSEKIITKQNGTDQIPRKSELYLEESTHYNDIKVPPEMQKRIGAKVSALIQRNVEFVDIHQDEIKKHKIKGGVKLFSSSESFLSCKEVKDTSTEMHNEKSKHVDKKRRRDVDGTNDLDENDKINAVVVSGDHVLSKEDIKFYKSRRKEKLFKYKQNGKSKVLTAID